MMEQCAQDHLDHGCVNRITVAQVATRLLADQDSVTLGAYVHVKTGVRPATRRIPETVKLLTAYVRQCFPTDPFLALEVKWSREARVHKDSQNSHCATLLCNLSEGSPGGTWIEDAAGSV